MQEQTSERIVGLSMDSFVAFDIELANSNPSSICEIALVKFVDGKADNAILSLLKPNPYDLVINLSTDDDSDTEDDDLFPVILDPIAQAIHGITAEELKNAPVLSDIWAEVLAYIGDLPLVAHNATQDIKKLLLAMEDDELELSDREYFCSLTISRNEPSTKTFESHRLEDVAVELGVDWFQIPRASGIFGHSALIDANSTGEIMVKLLERHSGSFSKLCESLEMIPGRIISNQVKNGNTKVQSKNPLWSTPSPDEFKDLVSFIAEKGFAKRENHPFFGKNFAISLWLNQMNETDFWTCVALCGGNMKTSVSKFTDFLVEGIDPKGKYIKGETTKSLKARELISERKSNIQVLDESTFLEMLGEDVLIDLGKFKSL